MKDMTVPVGIFFIGALVAVIVSITFVPHRSFPGAKHIAGVLTPA